MIIHQATNKSYLIVAVDPLTVKHMIFEIAMKNITGAAKCLLLATVVFPQRDTVTLPPFQSASQGMARLRGQDD
jgi:hypothetical protein